LKSTQVLTKIITKIFSGSCGKRVESWGGGTGIVKVRWFRQLKSHFLQMHTFVLLRKCSD